VTGISLLVRRRLTRMSGRARPSMPTLVLVVSIVLALSVLSELLLGFSRGSQPVRLAGPVGWVVLGAQPPGTLVSWGVMLFDGIDVAVQAPWLPVFPLVGLLLVAVGLVLVGSGARDILKLRASKTVGAGPP
jgi:ABC-type dipeptide/oligopeptide/nickel transport system permease subunit